MKVFSEVGIGNPTFASTEFENDDTSERRVSRFVIPRKISGFYIRIWIGRKVFILSTNRGLDMKNKTCTNFKVLFGIQGVL